MTASIAVIQTERAQALFWAKVNKSGPIMRVGLSRCWVWIAGVDKDGYGKFQHARAHRVSLEWHSGEQANGRHCLHSCDNPSCVNPEHLRWGTNQENTRDRVQRGRQSTGFHGDPLSRTGSNNGRAKLTESQVADIRAATGKHRDIAARFGVARPTVSQIKRGEHWKHVPSATDALINLASSCGGAP